MVPAHGGRLRRCVSPKQPQDTRFQYPLCARLDANRRCIQDPDARSPGVAATASRRRPVISHQFPHRQALPLHNHKAIKPSINQIAPPTIVSFASPGCNILNLYTLFSRNKNTGFFGLHARGTIKHRNQACYGLPLRSTMAFAPKSHAFTNIYPTKDLEFQTNTIILVCRYVL